MTKEQKEILESKRGQFVKIAYKKKLKTLKKYNGHNIVQVVQRTARAGVDYSHTRAFKEKVGTSEGADTHRAVKASQSLPYGEWLNFPYTIKHKGKVYLRFYKAPNDWRQNKFFLDGKEVAISEIETMLRSGELKASTTDVFNVAEENLLEIE